nr:ATP-binding protein [uncultured Peptostreptococcus sp.]
MYIKRFLEEQVLEASKSYPIVMVCGQRQVGKSTMLYHIKEGDRTYITLDDINARRLAETDPALFFETYPAPLIIDEFQRVPSLTMELKRIVDEKALKGQDNEGDYWLTGSQKFTMMKNVSETLAGRVAIFEMSTLSSAEIEEREVGLFSPSLDDIRARFVKAKKKDVHQVYQEIFKGGMPKLITSNIDRDRYYSDYVNTYLQKDISDFARIGKMREFENFLTYIAAHTSQELKYTEIAKSIGISSVTAKEWVSILEQSGIIFILHPYYNNITKRLVKTPKMYFLDTGLAAYLCRWPSPETLENGAMDGAFFETWVVSEIVKSYYNSGKKVDIYYYRDIDQKEIDLLVISGTKCYPIEIKKNKIPKDADKNFGVLKKINLEVETGLVLCMSDMIVPYNRGVFLCPISIL